MKVTVKNSDAVEEKPFPKLMVSRKYGLIVFFSKPKYGTCIYADLTEDRPGDLSAVWDMNQFTDFHGTVTLEND